MPQLVIEDMRILLPGNTDLAAWASALDSFFQSHPAWSEISIRGFEISQANAQSPLLQAQMARIDAPQGKIFFEKFLVTQTSVDKVTLSRAVLRLHGNMAG
jgi:hypothetical protein